MSITQLSDGTMMTTRERAPKERTETKAPLRLGDKVRKNFKFEDNKSGRWRGCHMRTLTGTVVYIHPTRRFYVLEFKVPCGKFRQSFFF